MLAAASNVGFYVNSSCYNIDLKNNIIDGSADTLVATHSYNIYTGLCWIQNTSQFTAGEMLITNVDSLFSDYSGMDFHHRAVSPAINAGTNVLSLLPVATFPDYDFAKDFDGNPRGIGGAWDIGAYEYNPTGVAGGNIAALGLPPMRHCPNPVSGQTRISYQISEAGRVALSVYNIAGQHVRTLVNEIQTPGSYSVNFSVDGLSPGVYLYRLEAASHTRVNRMVVIR